MGKCNSLGSTTERSRRRRLVIGSDRISSSNAAAGKTNLETSGWLQWSSVKEAISCVVSSVDDVSKWRCRALSALIFSSPVGHRRYKRTKVPPTQLKFVACSSAAASAAAATVPSSPWPSTEHEHCRHDRPTDQPTINHIRIGSSRSS